MWTLDGGRKIAIYCSDVSGAFDKVSSKRLLAKLRAKRIDPAIIQVLESWREPRTASVVVGGARSEPFCIHNMVYQGTVTGPQLWNLYFADAAHAIEEYMFEEVVYADDLNAYRQFASTTTTETALRAVGAVQEELHR